MRNFSFTGIALKNNQSVNAAATVGSWGFDNEKTPKAFEFHQPTKVTTLMFNYKNIFLSCFKIMSVSFFAAS